jgi:murein DD-endopeptidase MepM/ murein hydrolase activator NlpD
MLERRTIPIRSSKYPNKLWLLISISLVVLTALFIVTTQFQQKSTFINNSLELPAIEEEIESNLPEENNDWTTVVTKPNDTLGKIFNISGISQGTLQEILKNNPYASKLTNIKPNQQIRFLIHDKILDKILFPLNTTEYLTVNHEDSGYITKIESRPIETHEDFLTATIRGSLYTTAKKMKIPYQLIQQMISIFDWEINFSKDIREGDQFSILYKAFYVDDTKVNTGEIIAVEYKSKTKTHQAIAHANQNGDLDYFTPEGTSLKKAFSRYPIKFSHISSTFNSKRKHPVLNYVRPHKGIDLAARIGTPIHATGDGRVKTIGFHNGYGNLIKITHNKTYTTVYAHLLKFQKGLKRGDYVERGQIIGFVGQSGLATGPHCHYEFHINQKPQNPTTIKLPQAESIAKIGMPEFNLKANQIIASLKLYNAGKFADADTKRTATTG